MHHVDTPRGSPHSRTIIPPPNCSPTQGTRLGGAHGVEKEGDVCLRGPRGDVRHHRRPTAPRGMGGGSPPPPAAPWPGHSWRSGTQPAPGAGARAGGGHPPPPPPGRPTGGGFRSDRVSPHFPRGVPPHQKRGDNGGKDKNDERETLWSNDTGNGYAKNAKYLTGQGWFVRHKGIPIRHTDSPSILRGGWWSGGNQVATHQNQQHRIR